MAPELSLLTAEDCGCRDAINAFAKKQFEEKQAQKEEAQREEYIPHQPASYLRKVFSAEAPERPARLYITARGLYEASLNGQRVGDMVLAPGAWTADQHLGVQTYDVTDLIKEGDNVLDPADLETARFTAHAVYSDMSETGQFRCSDEDVNQLVRNSLWSMKSNSFRPALRGGGQTGRRTAERNGDRERISSEHRLSGHTVLMRGSV